MKIYEIGTGYTPIPAQIGAATEIVVEELAKSFIVMGKDVEIIDISAPNRSETHIPISEVKIPKIFIKTDLSLGILHKIKRVVYSIFLARKLNKILKKTEEKVIFHFHNQYNGFFFFKLVPKKLRKKCLVAYTNHNGYWSLEWEKVEKILRKKYFQEITCMKKADIVFSLNSQTKYNVAKYLCVEENKIVTIENGVNTDIYKPLSANEKFKIKTKYNFGGKKVILQIGSVYENKGQKQTIEKLKPLLIANDDLIYVYVGGIVDNLYKEEIDNYIRVNGLTEKVFYLGMVKPGIELNELYNMAELTIFHSQYEAFPLVIVESLSAGVPVLICMDREFNMGDGSIECDFSDMCKIVESVVSSSETREHLSIASRKNVISNYTWDTIAKKYFNNFLKE